MKTMRTSRDVTKEDILEIMERSKKVEEGKGKSLKGKILGVLSYRPSLRSTASAIHSMLKADGDYIVLDASYAKSGEEDLDDTMRAIADIVDILVMRTPMTVEIKDMKADLPVLNIMCGDEHTAGALWFFYSLYKRGVKLEGLKVGVYGQVKYSQPTIALYRMGAKLGMKFYEDSVVDEIGASEEVKKELGGNWEKRKIDEYIDEVDFMWISEGRPGEGASEETLRKFLEEYKIITPETMEKSKKECYWYFDEPRTLPDGRLTAVKECDTNKMLLNEPVMKESIVVNRALYEWALEV